MLVEVLHMPCGGVAFPDEAAGIGYRCEDCMAVIGSVGQSDRCKAEAQKYEDWKKLGGKGWNYKKGCPA